MTAPALPQLNSILMSREGRLLRITFNRPDQMNAVSLELHDELVEALLGALQFLDGHDGPDVTVLHDSESAKESTVRASASLSPTDDISVGASWTRPGTPAASPASTT